MTTAYKNANNGGRIPDQSLTTANFSAVGAGHVDPTAAIDPGLVYDISPNDYIPYLCGLRYTDAQVSAVARRTTKCSDYTPISGSELNYPSFMVILNDGNTVTVKRTVTNVGVAGSTYTADIVAPAGATVTVEPKTITFAGANEKKQFSVTFTGKATGESGFEYSEGYLTWVSSKHRVSSPVMVAVMASSGQSM